MSRGSEQSMRKRKKRWEKSKMDVPEEEGLGERTGSWYEEGEGRENMNGSWKRCR